jgi:nucleoside-diphosphate-sugar epimerase
MKDNGKTVLVIGGTGIVGLPAAMRLFAEGYTVHTISLQNAEEPRFPDGIDQHIVDRTSDEYSKFIHQLNDKVGGWDAVIDLIAFDVKSSEETYELLKKYTRHFITLSTTLVYVQPKMGDGPRSEQTPLVEEGESGGYVDGKLKIEKFWQSVSDANWTLLRPYHVLGRHSLLGCVPEHNRDPKLIDRIKNGETLKLCNGGEVVFNYIHPEDIATAICKVMGNDKTYRQAYNLVSSQPILARDYYGEIAHQLGAIIKIENIPMTKIWEEMKGWEMTTFNHVYSGDKLSRDIGFVPQIPLAVAIKDAIDTYPNVTIPTDQIPVHKRMNKLPKPKINL